MSYDIIYNKQGIRLRRTGEVIIMLLAGSNNCFEVGNGRRNGRRVRSWEAHRFFNRKGKLSEKPDIILKNLEKTLRKETRRHRKPFYDEKPPTAKEIIERYGWYAGIAVGGGACADTSWPKYQGVYVNAIKKALTIEELDARGVHLYFTPGWFYNQEGNVPPPAASLSADIRTEKEYFTLLKEWKAWQEISGKQFYLQFNPSDTDTVVRRLKGADGHKRPNSERTRVQQDHYFVLEYPNGYLFKYTRTGFRYTSFESSAKRFRTEKEAEKYRATLVQKRKHMAEQWKVKRVEGTVVFLK